MAETQDKWEQYAAPPAMSEPDKWQQFEAKSQMAPWTEGGEPVPEGGFGMGHYLKKSLPSLGDIGHAIGIPDKTERERLTEYTAAHPFKSAFEQTNAGLLGAAKTIADVPVSMAKETGRGIKGLAHGVMHPAEPSDPMAGVHLLSGLNPFAAPVVSSMTEQGLGTPQANATGLVGAGTLALPEIGKAVPPVIRGTARGVNAALERAPGAIGAGVGTMAGREFGHPGYGAAAGYALGRELLPKFKIPGERFGLPKEGLSARVPKIGEFPEVETPKPEVPKTAKIQLGKAEPVANAEGVSDYPIIKNGERVGHARISVSGNEARVGWLGPDNRATGAPVNLGGKEFRALKTQFESENPGIKLKITPGSATAERTAARAARRGQPMEGYYGATPTRSNVGKNLRQREQMGIELNPAPEPHPPEIMQILRKPGMSDEDMATLQKYFGSKK